MKICCPTTGTRGLDEKVGKHIRLVPTYTVWDTDTLGIEIILNNDLHGKRLEKLVEALVMASVDVMIVMDIDYMATRKLESVGIVVYTGARGTLRDALEMYDTYQLEPVTNEHICEYYLYLEEFNGASA